MVKSRFWSGAMLIVGVLWDSVREQGVRAVLGEVEAHGKHYEG